MQFDDDSGWHVTHAYNGNDILTFEIPTNSKYYKYIAEETKIDFTGSRMRDSRFVVKNVDEHSDFVTVNANIDLEDWQQNIIFEFRETNSYLYEILDKIIPNGWTYQGADVFDKRTTVEDTEGQPIIASTPLGILDKCPSAYGCVFNFDVVNNILLVIDPTEIESSGEYFTDELNLRSLGFVGNSDNFATRLYAYGKCDENGENPVTFESINDGKPYVEDKSYVNKVVSVGWSDERYETPQALLNAAREKLSELAKPTRSYSCEISDLGDNVWLYMVVTLIDRRRGTRVDHQVIEWNEYNYSYLDSVTLSATQPTINGLIDQIDDDFQDTINNLFVSINDIIVNTVDNATGLITGNKGGQFAWVFDEEGRPKELVNLADTDDINTAQNVWRWNASGLGHSNNGYNGQYELALLADGSINASMITTGILNAGVIRAGVITDVLGRNYWNLETGEFSLSASTTVDGELIVVRLDTQFAVNTSSTNAPSSGWSTNVPSYDLLTQFLWSRTATVYANGNVSYSDPVCLSAQGIDGKDGVGIDDVIDQYYLSTSSTTQSGGSWSTTQPTWQPNRYIWQRMQIEWSDGTTTTTAPYLANALNSANQTAHDAEQAAQDLDDSLDQQEIFNRLTNNGQTQGIFLSDGLLYLNASYISTGTLNANLIKAGILQDVSGQNYWNMETGEFRLAPGSSIGDSEIASKSDTISNVDVEYALGDTNTTAPTSGWSTDSVQWTEGKYIWQRTVTTMQDGTKSVSDPVCIQPATGASGDDGVGILQYQEEYYLSTSDTELSGGTWSTLQPAWVKGKYIWTSTVINWTDGSTTRTPPVLASAINGANETADEALGSVSILDESLNQQEIFNRLTNNGQTQGIFLSNGLLYLNASYISTGTLNANLIKAGILSDKSGKNTWNMVTGEMRLQGLDIYIEDAASSAADSAANDALSSAKDYADSVGSSTLTSSKNYTNTTVNTLIRLTSQGVEVGSTSSNMKSIVAAGSFLFKNGSTTILNMSGGTNGQTVSFTLPSTVGFRFESTRAAIFYANPNGYSFSSQRPSFSVHGVGAVETLSKTPSSQTNTTTIDISAYYNFAESVEYVVIYYRCTWSNGHYSVKVPLEQDQSRDTYLTAEAAQSNGIVFSHEGITLQLSGSSFKIIRGVTLDRRFAAAYPDNTGYKDATAIDWSSQFYIYKVNFCG